MALIPFRKPLAFPGGRPGFDPTHIAAPGTLLSAVISGKNALNVSPTTFASARVGTISGSPTFGIDGVIGPNASGFSGSDYISFTSAAQTAVNGTMAAIVYSPGGVNNGIFAVDNHDGPAIAGFSNTLFITGGLGDSTSGLAFPTGWSFVVASISGSAVSFLILNLSNGQTTTSFTTYNTVPTGSTAYWIGVEPKYSTAWPGKIAAVMHSSAYMSIPQLLEWAKDPWSFWYPPQVNSLIGQPAGVVVAGVLAAKGVAQIWGRAAATANTVAAAKGVSSTRGRSIPLIAMPLRAAGITETAGRPQASFSAIAFAKGWGKTFGKSAQSLAASIAAKGAGATRGASTAKIAMPLAVMGAAKTVGKALGAFTAFVFTAKGTAMTTGRASSVNTLTMITRGQSSTLGRALALASRVLSAAGRSSAFGRALATATAGLQTMSGAGLARTTGKAATALTLSLASRGRSSAVGRSAPVVAMVLAARSSVRTMGSSAATVGVMLVTYGRGQAQTFGRATANVIIHLTALSGLGLLATAGRAKFASILTGYHFHRGRSPVGSRTGSRQRDESL